MSCLVCALSRRVSYKHGIASNEFHEINMLEGT